MDAQLDGDYSPGKIVACFAQCGDAAATFRDLGEMAEAFLDGFKVAIRKRDDRIAALEAKLVRLEATIEQRNFAYLGVWKEGKIYNPGSFVTYSGAVWHCNQFHTTARPGDGAAAWTLAVKSGRDGKDGRDAKGAP